MGETKWRKLEATEHRLAISGSVVDAFTKSFLPGVTVEMTNTPAAFQDLLASWSLAHANEFNARLERPDRTMTFSDGSFRFVDLPDGAYDVSFSMTHHSEQYGSVQKHVNVARGDDGKIVVSQVFVELPPTGIRGRVVTQKEGETIPIALARIRLSAGDLPAYTDADGKFAITGVFPGRYRMSIGARGYVQVAATSSLTRGQILEAGDFILEPEPV